MRPSDLSTAVTPPVVPEIVTLPVEVDAVTALTGESRPAAQPAPLTKTVKGQDRIRNWSSGGLAVVTTPTEVGSANAQELWAALDDACRRHVVTIVDMTATVVCGYDTITVLLMALRCTDASGGELWLAVSAEVDRLVSATAVGGAFTKFRRLRDAVASLPARWPDLF